MALALDKPRDFFEQCRGRIGSEVHCYGRHAGTKGPDGGKFLVRNCILVFKPTIVMIHHVPYEKKSESRGRPVIADGTGFLHV